MLAPISWLQNFVDIKLPLKDLMWRLTEVGLTCEKVTDAPDGDKILELEITPNRPDCLSVIGVAREIAAIQSVPLKTPNIPNIPNIPNNPLPMAVNNDFRLCPRYTAVSIAGIAIKPSPKWLAERLTKAGLRPINNIVDITNYTMWDLGIPVHAFDYDKIKGQKMTVHRANGGEEFTSVDELKYKLPKDAIVISDAEGIIDLCGIKGGLNSGITEKTQNIFLHVPVYDPVLVRRASQALGLKSEASSIYERGADKGGTLKSLSRAVNLILEQAGGHTASSIIDLKEEEFNPWAIEVSHNQITKILGIDLKPDVIISLLSRLSLSVDRKLPNANYLITIPTYRNDLQISEDIIEEAARLYGYNNFPKTLPKGEIPVKPVAYSKDYAIENKVKDLLWGMGLSEIYTYSLVDKSQIQKLGLEKLAGEGNSQNLKISNPVSREYEFLRPTLIGNMLEALKLNEPFDKPLQLFELGKIYNNTSPVEPCRLTLGFSQTGYLTAKGILEELLRRLNIPSIFLPATAEHNSRFVCSNNQTKIKVNGEVLGMIGEINLKTQTAFNLKHAAVIADLDFSILEKHTDTTPVFHPIPQYPPIIEDFSFILPPRTYIGPIIEKIKSLDLLIAQISLIDSYGCSRTLRIVYQNLKKNISDKDVKPIREKIKKLLTSVKDQVHP